MPRSIRSVYDHYHVPIHIRQHMYMVAALGAHMCDHWIGAPLIRKDMVTALLIHDIGNILKMDVLTRFDPGEPEKSFAYWAKLQDTYRQSYTDDHDMNAKIPHELNLNSTIVRILKNMGSEHLADVPDTDDEAWKVALYCDQRVAPTGYCTITTRYADLAQRYKHKTWHRLSNPKVVEAYLQEALQLERHIQQYVDIDLQQLDLQTLDQIYTSIANTEV